MSPRAPRGASRERRRDRGRRAVMARDAGLRRISRVTRWIVAGVVALSGGLALIAANAFHGHTIDDRLARATILDASRRPRPPRTPAPPRRHASPPGLACAGADAARRRPGPAGRRLRRIMTASTSWPALGTTATVVVVDAGGTGRRVRAACARSSTRSTAPAAAFATTPRSRA